MKAAVSNLTRVKRTLWCYPTAISVLTGADYNEVNDAAHRAKRRWSGKAMTDAHAVLTLRELGWRAKAERYDCRFTLRYLLERHLDWWDERLIVSYHDHVAALHRSMYFCPLVYDNHGQAVHWRYSGATRRRPELILRIDQW